jgi:hypothetical protein
MKLNQIKNFLDDLQKIMDTAVWGHDEAKRQIIQIIGQQFRNPKSKGNILGIWGPPGNGKCFAWDTPIMMYDATFKKVQDIIIGDVVMGDDSRPRNVLSLGSGEDEMYEIISNDGESYTVNSEHILCLKSFNLNKIKKINNNKFMVSFLDKIKLNYRMFNNYNEAKIFLDNIDPIVEITVKDYLKLPTFIKYKLKGYKVGLDFEKKEVKLNPYGCKNIPSEYLLNDRETRMKLLAGLIDIYGYYNKTTFNFEIIQKSKELSDDTLFLCRSLGFKTTRHDLNDTKETSNKLSEPMYRLHISGNNLSEIPSLRFKIQDNHKLEDVLVSSIRVKSKGRGNYYGFTLDGNNRFLLGNFTVTHNTSLIKEGVAKAMGKPFVFISLGGATDASFLEGHSYTYEGSIYGRIATGLIASKCMDPIFYFDELDKISQTHKGQEITNLLVHLTDPVQNSHFRDKYFHNIDLDLSRATFIFSYNDPSLVDRVLMDRITQVETKYLLPKQKLYIAQNYLIPDMLKEVGLEPRTIIFEDNLINKIIETYTREGGVRKLKSLLFNIIRELNLANLTKYKIDNKNIVFPYKVLEENIKYFLRHKNEIEYDKIHKDNKVGVINGLYASSLGVGGVLPIETMWIPSSAALSIKATGSLEKVITESTQVACSLAWNYLDSETRTKYLKEWKDYPQGFHIHCPDGSTPKDGPSAGCALSLVIYSMLTNKKIKHDIAITGEINLQGKVTAIGGLEEKLEGAKRAGVKKVLFPKENMKDISRIKERNPTLIDNDFQVNEIESLDEAIKLALVI